MPDVLVKRTRELLKAVPESRCRVLLLNAIPWCYQPPETSDLAGAKARKERAHAEKLEMDVAIQKRKYAPIGLLTEVMGKLVKAWSAQFETMVATLTHRYPAISRKDRERLIRDLRALQNDIADADIKI